MILPAKHLTTQRSLIGVGARLLALLEEPCTVSALWESFRKSPGERLQRIPFDWFVLSLDLLFMLGAIRLDGVLLKREGTQ